jgi:acetolactate synthase I/II/III large subunit
MARINGGVVLAKSFRALGVSEVFALHGGHLDAFLVACQAEGIRLTDTRHEATAGHAAEGYARASGQVGVCVITAGPGFTNALTAMVDAWLDAIPVVFVAGSPPLREVETNPLQGGFDQVAMAAPATKWAHRITHVERIPDLVAKAVRTAMTGRPGPVFLEVPIDVMFGPLDEARLALPAAPGLSSAPAPSPEAVGAIASLLAAAERPVVIAGGGTTNARCADLLKAFAEAFAVPVVTSSKANGVMPAGHPFHPGAAGTLGVASLSSHKADLVILLGAREGLFLGGRGGAVIPDGVKLVQVDVNAAEIGRVRTPDVAVTADAAETLAALIAHGGGEKRPAGRDAWAGVLAACAKASRGAFMDEPLNTRPGLIHPYHAARGVAEALSEDTAITFDGGEACAWYAMVGRSPGPGLYMGNGYLGCLGVGQGYAVGFARARPHKPIAIIMGDGAVGFHIGEFDTMVRHGLPILTVVFNNSCWGMSKHGQEIVFGRQNLATVQLAPTDYHRVAEGFGAAGERIDRFEDIGPAVRRAQARGGPTCLNIMTDPEVVHPVTPMMIGEFEAKDQIAIPYYENIPAKA